VTGHCGSSSASWRRAAPVAAYLTYTRFAHSAIACTTGGCETVQSSRYAELAGIPVPLLGLGAYVAILATAFSTSELARAGAPAIALAGAAFSATSSTSSSRSSCHWCAANDAVIALLAVATALRIVGGRRVAVATG
jgi:uncharacterized membrane protein